MGNLSLQRLPLQAAARVSSVRNLPETSLARIVLAGSCEEGVGTGFREQGRGSTLGQPWATCRPERSYWRNSSRALLLPPALVSRAHASLFHSPCFHFLFQGNSANTEVFLLLVDILLSVRNLHLVGGPIDKY